MKIIGFFHANARYWLNANSELTKLKGEFNGAI